MTKTRKGKHRGEGEYLRRGIHVSKGPEMAGNKNPSQILRSYQWLLSVWSRETRLLGWPALECAP